MRISDWSSDVCSSDLQAPGHRLFTGGQAPVVARDGVRELGREAPHLEDARRDLGMGQAVDLALGLGVLAVGGDDLPLLRVGPAEQGGSERSDEHTSELQSLMRHSSAVFCLKTQTERN